MKKLLQVKFKHFLASSTLCAICALKEKDIKYLAISICFLTNICKNAEDNSNNSNRGVTYLIKEKEMKFNELSKHIA